MRPWINLSTVLSGIALSKPLATLASFWPGIRHGCRPSVSSLRHAGGVVSGDRSDVRVGIVSNTEALLTRFELDTFPILQTAEAIVLSSDVGVRKPEPEIFQLAVNRIGATSDTTVFIGNDWAADVLGARRAGIRAIYLNEEVTAGVQTRTDIEGVYAVAPTLEAISTALRLLGWYSGDS
jgi:FMN phosphatase YigB (HAD superfamily)